MIKEKQEMNTTTFGGFLKELRLARRHSLRAFAEMIGWDPANYSKVERSKLSPPSTQQKLEPFRNALGLSDESPEWRELVRLAALQRGEVPPRIMSNEQLLAKLPALFRTLEGERIDENTLDELIAAIKREW